MKTAIVYHSTFGSTKKYANWLSDRIDADLFSMRVIDAEILDDYQQIVVMSGTYAAQMPLTKFLTSNWDFIKDKKVVVVAVGAAPADDEQSKKSFEMIPEQIRKKVSYFKIPGRLFGINKDKVVPGNLDPIAADLR